MLSQFRLPFWCFGAGLALFSVGCATEEPVEVDAAQIEGSWVFSYSETPDFNMNALGSGEAVVVDGCLQMGDAVVVWHADQLALVEEALVRLNAGEAVIITVGGGGQSLDEGATVDDFPAGVTAHCSPTAIWFASPEAPTIE